MKLLCVAVAVALLAAAEGKKYRKPRKDGIFTNFGAATEVGAHHAPADAAPHVSHSAAAVHAAPQPISGDVSYDPRLPDPPCVWTAWSKCDVACGGGSAYRLRRITDECEYGPAQQLKICNAQPCPHDCVLGDWSSWGCGSGCFGCSVPCGGGSRTRTRPVLSPALFGGRCPARLSQTEPCNEAACPLDCIATSVWGAWGSCSAACGGGRRERARGVEFLTVVRKGESQTQAQCPEGSQEEPCATQLCPLDCRMEELTGWSEWSRCSATCGDEGQETRHREILQHPQNGGNDCPPALEIRQCEEELAACAVNDPADPWPMRGDPIILPPLPKDTALPVLIEAPAPETTPLPAIPDGFCSGRADGPYAHPACLCCNDLIMCFQRSAILKWCPPGEIFVGEWAKCVRRAEAPNC